LALEALMIDGSGLYEAAQIMRADFLRWRGDERCTNWRNSFNLLPRTVQMPNQ
jgi:hypothetical protein